MDAHAITVRYASMLAGVLSMSSGSPRSGGGRAPASGESTRDRSASSAGANNDQNGPGKDRDESEPRTAAEWTVLAVSALVVALLVGAALYEHFAQDEPPGVRITVELALDQAEARDGLTYIPFTVVNSGREPAENVQIRFEIKQGDETVEESTTEFGFLPNSGSAEGELVTTLDLSTHTVQAQVATIQKP